ncbi:MAG: hypothetical protein ACRDKT_08325 [Actinomycetota bacterium]
MPDALVSALLFVAFVIVFGGLGFGAWRSFKRVEKVLDKEPEIERRWPQPPPPPGDGFTP